MKTVILAGGFGSRLHEETDRIPKPLVEVGGKPLLWHIMHTYSRFGFNDFIIALGYKGNQIKDYFTDYLKHSYDIQVNTNTGEINYHIDHTKESWKITLIDTGLETDTGGRLKRLYDKGVFGNDTTFMCTYGDGLANVDIPKLLEIHKLKNKLATLTAVKSVSRFGEITYDADGLITSFEEKSRSNFINGGFFVFEISALKYLHSDKDSLEKQLLTKLTDLGQLNMYIHNDFWKCADTYKEIQELNSMCHGKIPWEQYYV